MNDIVIEPKCLHFHIDEYGKTIMTYNDVNFDRFMEEVKRLTSEYLQKNSKQTFNEVKNITFRIYLLIKIMEKFTHIWLFKFIAYSYCQGTRDRYEAYKLLILTLPCGKFEAIDALKTYLKSNKIEFEPNSIESENIFITNS